MFLINGFTITVILNFDMIFWCSLGTTFPWNYFPFDENRPIECCNLMFTKISFRLLKLSVKIKKKIVDGKVQATKTFPFQWQVIIWRVGRLAGWRVCRIIKLDSSTNTFLFDLVSPISAQINPRFKIEN